MSTEPAAPAPVFTELSVRRLGPVRRFVVRHPVIVDLLLILLFAGWALLVGAGADAMYSLHAELGGGKVLQMQLASLALTVVGVVVLLWRRRRPVVVAASMAILGVVALGTTGATSGFEVGIAIALYAVATSERPAVTWATFTAPVTALLVSALVFPLPATVGAMTLGIDPADVGVLEVRSGGFLQSAVWYQTAAPVLVLALLAVALGTSVRNRRLHLASFLDAANALARDHEQRARLAQAAERTRIAREMHDVVAHSISVMVALGGGAAAALEWAPERSRTALDELVATGRAALADMRRVLGILHDDAPEGDADGPPADAGSSMGPQPSSLDLITLIERFRTAGLPVRTTGLADTGLDELDMSLQLAVYRIIQEALTNALRHAPGTPSVEVSVRREAGRIEVIVTDRGRTLGVDPAHGSERGLVGIRERAAVFGGTVEAGPHGSGWRVRAVLPWDEGDA